MAAVICYLSVDNHMADTPPMNSPKTGLRKPAESLFPAPVFELSVSMFTTICTIYLCVCVCLQI